MTLEQKIRDVLAGKTGAAKSADQIVQESVTEIVEDETININVAGGDKKKDKKDGDDADASQDADGDDQDGGDADGQDGGDGKTDVSKDPGSKDKVKVVEDQDVALPGESKKVTVGDKHGTDSTETNAAKNAKIEKNHKNKEEPAGSGGVKLKDPAGGKSGASDAQTSADNAKIDGSKTQDPKKGLTMKEHIEALLEGSELTEEFKKKATTIFEAAVTDAAQAKFAELVEQHETELQEAVNTIKTEIEEQVDGYLTYVVEQWVKDNSVALERGIKEELVSDFIDGLKDLFKKNYVEIPEEKVDVISGQADKIDELTKAQKKLSEDNEKLVKEVAGLKRKALVESAGSDLTATQREKFAGLTESVEFTTDEEFKGKIKTIKESYFRDGKDVKSAVPAAGDDAPVLTEDSKNQDMDRYTKALSKPLNFLGPKS
jgi:hypothetical protein